MPTFRPGFALPLDELREELDRFWNTLTAAPPLHGWGVRPEQPGRPIRQEYGIGNYRRSFRRGEGFDASGITADYARGVLTVRVPRLAAVRPRKVEVRAG